MRGRPDPRTEPVGTRSAFEIARENAVEGCVREAPSLRLVAGMPPAASAIAMLDASTTTFLAA